MSKDRNVPLGIGLLGGNAKVYNTIAEMQQDSKLKVGKVVEVLGYYSAGDGSNHKRVIKSEDDGSGVQLSNGLYANIVHNGEVNVSWFGAKGDGITDDTQAIQQAINYNLPILIEKDLLLKSELLITSKSVQIKGLNNNINIKKITLNDCDKVIFKNINFKSNDINSLYIPLLLNRCSNIEVQDCVATLNRNGTQEGEGYYTIKLNECNNIFVNNFKQLESYPEGIYFETCNDIKVINSSFISKTSGIWTNIHFFYCKNAILKNCKIESVRGEGSTINFTCQDSFIENCEVIGGAGVDISNETTVNFPVENITIKNNYIKTKAQGVYDYPYLPSPAKNINIIGNNINTENFSLSLKGVDYTILGNIFNVTSKDNYSSTISVNPEVKANYLIKNNTSNGSAIFINLNGNIGNMQAINNNVTLKNIEDTSSASYSSGAFILNKTGTVEEIKIIGNNAFNISNSLFGYYTDIKSNFTIDIKDNIVKTKKDYVNTRQIYINAGGTLNFTGNILINSGGLELEPGNINKNIICNNCFISEKDLKSNIITSRSTPLENTIVGNNVFQNTTPDDIYYTDSDLPKKNAQVSQLNTLYHMEKMKQEGVYDDYISYMDEKTAYDKQQRKLEQDRQLAYEEALKENPELTYEEFMSLQPMTLNLLSEPEPSEALKKFMEKYL